MAPTSNKSLPPMARTNIPVSPRRKIMIDVFNMFDADGSGEIELDEIIRAFQTTGKLTDETRAQLKAHFDFMDSDGSGEVTLDEFQSALGLGKIAFRDYQHQQVYNSLGLTLCQNLVVYRRHVLNQQFKIMRQQLSPRGASDEMPAVKQQFDCLVRALVMSTFALNLKASAEAQLVYGGGNGVGGGQGEGKGRLGRGGWRPEKGSGTSSPRTRLREEDEQLHRREARVLAETLKAGYSQRYLRPLSPSRRRRLRAGLVADVAAARKCRDNNNRGHRTGEIRPPRVVLKKLPQKGPRRVHGPALAF